MAKTYGTQESVEKAVLVGVSFDKTVVDIESNLAELKGLAKTAGLEVVGYCFQNIKENTPATLIGKGKVEEVAMMAQELDADVVILDCELTGSQINNLQIAINRKVIDRSMLILDIFIMIGQFNLYQMAIICILKLMMVKSYQ